MNEEHKTKQDLENDLVDLAYSAVSFVKFLFWGFICLAVFFVVAMSFIGHIR